MSWDKLYKSKRGNPRIRITKNEYEFLQQYRNIKNTAYGKVEENGEELTITSRISQSIEDIVKEYKIDTNLWECVAFKPGNWTTPVKAKFQHEEREEDILKERIRATIPLVIENRKSEAQFRKRTQIIDYDKFRRELVEDLKRFAPKITNEYHIRPVYQSGNLLEVNIPDLHLGKQSWAEETGFRNYDIKIAAQRYRDAFDDMLSRVLKENKFDEILFVVGNDLFNSDNAYPITTTTAGTPQQDDARWQKVFRLGRQLMIESILKLEKIAPRPGRPGCPGAAPGSGLPAGGR